MGKDTKLIIFCSTVYNDDAWNYITNYFEDKGNAVESYTSLFYQDPDNPKVKTNILREILKELEQEAEESRNNDDTYNETENKPDDLMTTVRSIVLNNEADVVKKKRKKKDKYRIPKIIFVFDDLSTELKDPSLLHLLKRNRHFLCKTIISSQYLIDLDISGRKNIDYYLLFKNQNDKLPFVYKDAGINSISYETFVKIYNYAVSEPYSFLYIDSRTEEFRIKFDKVFNIKKQ